MLAAMMPATDRLHHDAVALMELVNRRLLDGRLTRLRLRHRCGATSERRVLDDQALSRLIPDLALAG
jgi:hypothetical protein